MAESNSLGLAGEEGGLAPLSFLRTCGLGLFLFVAAVVVFVVAAFGLIFGRRTLAIPRRGCVNVHASLLPAFRG
ncbi:MAG TPA: formyltransferase family protein, partial [Pyrinomonadaceae bacterium]|nr:formyltransferase family protein [Pyrinomonadaceae bacterium]